MFGIVGLFLLFCVILAIVKPASKTPGVKAWFGDLYKLLQFGLRVLFFGGLAAAVWWMIQAAGRA